MKIINNSRSPLGIPGYGMIEPNGSKIVAESIKDHIVIAAWFKAGMLVEDGVQDDPPKPEGQEDTTEDSNIEHSGDDDEKDALIAALADNGIHKTRRSTVKTLREALSETEE